MRSGLQWSDSASPNYSCRYHHAIAVTPLGRIYIEWKGWKESPAFTASLPWGAHVVASDLDEAKRLVQAAWDEMVDAVGALQEAPDADAGT